MRIISKFKDYYDSALAVGEDSRLTYLREERVVLSNPSFVGLRSYLSKPHDLPEMDVLLKFFWPRTQGWQQDWNHRSNQRFTMLLGCILFAGKLHPFVRMAHLDLNKNSETQTFGYSLEETIRWCEQHKATVLLEKLRKNAFIGSTGYLENKPVYRRDFRIKDFFDLSGDSRFEDMAYRCKTPVVVLEPNKQQLKLDAALAPYEFFKKLNAWQALQELSLFMGNLAAPDRVPVSISDKDRVVQHGFDEMSFRKAPTKRFRA